jgi:hypothetical protein
VVVVFSTSRLHTHTHNLPLTAAHLEQPNSRSQAHVCGHQLASMTGFSDTISTVTPRLGLGDSVRETASAITDSVVEGFTEISWSIKLAGIYIGVGASAGSGDIGAG